MRNLAIEKKAPSYYQNFCDTMVIEVLRLGHRKERDKRLTTHIMLSCRVLNISRVYYAGEKDEKLEKSIQKVEEKWGKCLYVEYIKNPLKLIRDAKNRNYKIIHLTMYGIPYKQKIHEIKEHDKILIIVGSEKVPNEIYEIANYNIAIGNQPHSELTALTILTYEINDHELKECSNHAALKIIPQEKGKKVIMHDK